MNYYIINPSNLTIISGPHILQSKEIKKLTNCGNPEALPINTLLNLGIVPCIMPSLENNQKYGSLIVYANRVEFAVVSKTQEDLNTEINLNIFNMRNVLIDILNEQIWAGSSGMIWDKAKDKSKVKSNAIKTWVETAWTLFATRKAQLKAGAAFNDTYLDFSSLGPIPYDPLEAMAE